MVQPARTAQRAQRQVTGDRILPGIQGVLPPGRGSLRVQSLQAEAGEFPLVARQEGEQLQRRFARAERERELVEQVPDRREDIEAEVLRGRWWEVGKGVRHFSIPKVHSK